MHDWSVAHPVRLECGLNVPRLVPCLFDTLNTSPFRGRSGVQQRGCTVHDRPGRQHCRRQGRLRQRGEYVVSIAPCAVRYPLTHNPLACFGSALSGALRLVQIPCARPLIDRLFYNTALPVTRRSQQPCTRLRAQGFFAERQRHKSGKKSAAKRLRFTGVRGVLALGQYS